MNKKVVLAFSGGKDSIASAILLKKWGYNVQAVYMEMNKKLNHSEAQTLKSLSDKLEINLKIINLQQNFQEEVIEKFLKEYKLGRTPNPCAICNQHFKFNKLTDYAFESLKANFFATGHYAKIKIIDNHYLLSEPKDKIKSQIYFMSLINPLIASKLIFPLADLSIEEVKELLIKHNISINEPSQNACFLNNKKLKTYLKDYLPEMFKKGNIYNQKGEIIGVHEGALQYTIGQRRGTVVSSDKRLYIGDIDIKKNTITLVEENFLYKKKFFIESFNLWYPLNKGKIYNIKIRHGHEIKKAIVRKIEKNFIKLEIEDKGIKGVAYGQVCAIYEDDILIAAGIISKREE